MEHEHDEAYWHGFPYTNQDWVGKNYIFRLTNSNVYAYRLAPGGEHCELRYIRKPHAEYVTVAHPSHHRVIHKFLRETAKDSLHKNNDVFYIDSEKHYNIAYHLTDVPVGHNEFAITNLFVQWITTQPGYRKPV